MGLDKSKLPKNPRICSYHFSTDCYQPGTNFQNRLKQNAVPTLGYARSVPLLPQNTSISELASPSFDDVSILQNESPEKVQSSRGQRAQKRADLVDQAEEVEPSTPTPSVIDSSAQTNRNDLDYIRYVPIHIINHKFISVIIDVTQN